MKEALKALANIFQDGKKQTSSTRITMLLIVVTILVAKPYFPWLANLSEEDVAIIVAALAAHIAGKHIESKGEKSE